MDNIYHTSLELPSYQYVRLDESVTQTRFAELLPGSFEDDIHLKIHSQVLSSSDGSPPEQLGFSLADLEEALPEGWIVRETINGSFIFEPRRHYAPQEPYETAWEHPEAKIRPVANNYSLLHTRPEYEALSHVWGPEDDQATVYIRPTGSPLRSASGTKLHLSERSEEQSQPVRNKRAADDESILPCSKRSAGIIGSRQDVWSLPTADPQMAKSGEEPRSEAEPALSTLTIRADLALALRHLRYKKRSRILWVDNICINQGGTVERIYLVRHMGQIYRLAQKVGVWIGPEREDSDLAMSTLEHLGMQVEITNKGSWRVIAPACLKPTWSRTAIPLPYDSDTWNSIAALLERPWFKRLWVWQEAKLSNDESIIQCGKKMMELYRIGVAA
jgi:hypothetical protein